MASPKVVFPLPGPPRICILSMVVPFLLHSKTSWCIRLVRGSSPSFIHLRSCRGRILCRLIYPIPVTTLSHLAHGQSALHLSEHNTVLSKQAKQEYKD